MPDLKVPAGDDEISSHESSKRSSWPLLSPEQTWITLLVLISTGILSASVIYALSTFNLAEQERQYHEEHKEALQIEIGASVLGRADTLMNSAGDTCEPFLTTSFLHVDGNQYQTTVDYRYIATKDLCTFANDGDCDEPNLCDPGTDNTDCGSESRASRERNFQCRIEITSDGNAWQWGLRQPDSDCLLLSDSRVMQACYGSE